MQPFKTENQNTNDNNNYPLRSNTIDKENLSTNSQSKSQHLNNTDDATNDLDNIQEIDKPKNKRIETNITTHKKLLKKLHIAQKDVETKEYFRHPKIRCKLFLVVDNCEHLTKTFDFNHFFEQFNALNINVIKRGLPIGDYAFILRIWFDGNLENHQWILRKFKCFTNNLNDLKITEKNEIY